MPAAPMTDGASRGSNFAFSCAASALREPLVGLALCTTQNSRFHPPLLSPEVSSQVWDCFASFVACFGTRHVLDRWSWRYRYEKHHPPFRCGPFVAACPGRCTLPRLLQLAGTASADENLWSLPARCPLPVLECTVYGRTAKCPASQRLRCLHPADSIRRVPGTEPTTASASQFSRITAPRAVRHRIPGPVPPRERTLLDLTRAGPAPDGYAAIFDLVRTHDPRRYHRGSTPRNNRAWQSPDGRSRQLTCATADMSQIRPSDSC